PPRATRSYHTRVSCLAIAAASRRRANAGRLLGRASRYSAKVNEPMRLDFSGERILAVVAHPDDAELLCAGTLAKARQDGATIGICVLCQGDKGQPATPIPNLAEVRS